MTSESIQGAPPDFSLTEGGPFHRVLTRLRIRQPDSMIRSWWVGLAMWLPIAAGEGVRLAAGMPVDAIFADLSLHVRLLFSLPILLLSENLLEGTSRSAIKSFIVGSFSDPARFAPILARAERWRDSWIVEAALAMLAVLGGQFVLWGLLGPTGWIHGGDHQEAWSFARLWYVLITLPLFQFVLFRVLWRWLIWTYIIVHLSRLPLQTLATHADFAAGLSPLARPVTGFAGIVLAMSALLSAAWGNQILEQRTTVEALLPGLVTFLLLVAAIALGPLLMFTGHLFRARRIGLTQYGDFVRSYTLLFHAKWIVNPAARRDSLGSPDIQSLNDLGSAYQVVAKSRVFVFGPHTLFILWFAGVLPMVPLLTSKLTVEQVLKQIISTVIGGFPL